MLGRVSVVKKEKKGDKGNKRKNDVYKLAQTIAQKDKGLSAMVSCVVPRS